MICLNPTAIVFFLGQILRLEALFLVPALVIALRAQEASSVFALAVTILLAGGLGLLSGLCKGDRSVSRREGYVIVSLSWVLMSLVGALPFRLSGFIPNYLDAFFEAVSGLTTTGSTILTDIESLPLSLHYWRCFTNWLGGMGILVFVLAVVPSSKGKGDALHVLRAEIPGPTVGKLAPTMRRSTRLLYAIYIAMTLLQIFFLICGGMPPFDAVLTAFATAGTGGFGIKNASLAAYDSYYLQAVVAIFLVLFGINFNLYYLLLLGRLRQALRSEELQVYFGVIAVATLAIAVDIHPLCTGFLDALHHSFFQVASMITTAAFVTTDYTLWPSFSHCILLALMMIGACGGSTGGGIKVARIILLWKNIKASIQKMLHPRSVKVIKMDGKPVDSEVMEGAQAFLALYLLVIFCSLAVVALDNFNLETTVTSVISCLNNVGIGLSMIGPTGNFSAFSPLSKIVLTIDMLLGRLEIFPMLLLFSPTVWRTHSNRP